MRITADFSAGLKDLALPLAVGFWLLAAAGVYVSTDLWMRGTHMQHHRVAVRQRLDAWRRRVAGMGRVRAPAPAVLQEIERRVARVNAVSGVRGWPLLRVLAELETVWPKGAVLIRLTDQANRGRITFVVQSRNGRSLMGLLGRLQAQPHFQHVLLTKQVLTGAGASVRCRFLLLEARP